MAKIKQISEHFHRRADGQRKRSRTRAQLMDAAISLMSEKGIAQSSIVEIAAAAGIGNSSFYYHFATKQQLVDAVGKEVVRTLIKRIRSEPFDDIAERLAYGAMVCLDQVEGDPAWGWMIIRVLEDAATIHEPLADGLRADIREGVAIGRFTVQAIDVAAQFVGGINAAGIRARFDGHPREVVAIMTAEHTLRMLGIRNSEANTIARRVRDRFWPQNSAVAVEKPQRHRKRR
jgi:AcrR family transcriptional regulator